MGKPHVVCFVKGINGMDTYDSVSTIVNMAPEIFC